MMLCDGESARGCDAESKFVGLTNNKTKLNSFDIELCKTVKCSYLW
jgi:hypothetical protein